MYEGRTRGKKLKYTYSDDEEFLSDEGPSRRSARNTSTTVTPAEPSRPRFTASGRQIRSRAGGLYGEALLAGQHDDYEEEAEDQTRPQRARTSIHPNGYSGYGVDDLEDESEAASSGNESGNDWKGGDDDDNDMEGDDEGDDASGDESIANGEPPSLVVQLRYGKGKGPSVPVPVDKPPPTEHVKPHEMSGVEIPVKSSAPEPQSRPSYAPEAMVNPPEPSKPEQMVEVPSFVPPTPVPQSDPLAAQAVPASTGPSTQEIPSPASADPPKHNNVGEFGDSRGPAFGTGD